MDDRQIGRVLRAVRIERRLRQADVGRLAGVDQKQVSLAERGHLGRISLEHLRRIAAALEVDLVMSARWRGGESDRLIDRGHAALVEAVAGRLAGGGWEVVVEFTFNHYGDRGSVDVLGWHAGRRALAIVEVKTSLADLQQTLASMNRKRRIVPRLVAQERDWAPVIVGSILAISGTTGNRRRVAAHAATFRSVMPGGSVEARRWIRAPEAPLAAVWFLEGAEQRAIPPSTVRRVAVRRRVPDQRRCPPRLHGSTAPEPPP